MSSFDAVLSALNSKSLPNEIDLENVIERARAAQVELSPHVKALYWKRQCLSEKVIRAAVAFRLNAKRKVKRSLPPSA